MSKEEIRKKLVEELGVHFEEQHNLPPLAARIFAYLILTDGDGVTFDDCQEKRNASKSSVSSSLNLLLKLGIITYFTKSGDRRRFFRIAEDNSFFLAKMNGELKAIENERKIVEKVVAFNKEYNVEKYRDNEVKKRCYLAYLEKSEAILLNAINELSKS